MSEQTTRKHSRFGGSKAERWMNCASSVGIAEMVPEAPSRYATEGTLAHEVAAFCLSRDLRTSRAPLCERWIVQEKFDVPIDMLDAVDVYLDAVWAEHGRHPNAELVIEATFVLDDLEGVERGEVFGSNDAIVYHPAQKRLVVFDYKHGAGVSVSSDDNAQLKFYALGAVLSDLVKGRGAREIELVIVQPRAFAAEEGAVKSWSWELSDVLDFKVDIEDAIARAKRMFPFFPGAPRAHWPAGHMEGAYSVGDWCRFCPAAAVCPGKARQALDATGLDFKDVTEITTETLPSVEAMTPEQISKALAAVERFVQWGSQLHEHIETLIRNGTDVPGWKIVPKVARAKWIEDDAKIAGWLVLQGVDEELVRPRKLVTITEAERVLKAELGGEEFKAAKETLRLQFTIKEPSGTTLAPASDKREAVNAVATDFASVQIAAE